MTTHADQLAALEELALRSTALTSHVDLGAVWLERGGQQVHVDFEELLPLVRNLLVHHDALSDAR